MSLGSTKMTLLLVVGLSVTVAAGAATTGFDIGGQPVSIDATETVSTDETDSVIRISATLNNTGTANVSRSVALLVDANGARTAVEEHRVTIPPRATKTVSFAVPPAAVEPGTVAYAIVVNDGNGPTVLRNGTVTLDAPRFVPTDATASSVLRGEEASVRATIRNRGDFRGTQTLELRLDRDRDGEFGSTEVVATAAPIVAPGERTEVALTLPTEGLPPGTYAYRLASPDGTTEGTLTVLQPATFRFEEVDAPATVTRGAAVNVTATVRNAGDVSGAATVRFDPPSAAGEGESRSVRLDEAGSRTLRFTLNTTALARGNYSVDLAVANETASIPLRVRESRFEVTGIRGHETLVVGEELRFNATIHNTGDAPDNQSVELRIDLDGDDEPEPHGINQSVALDPGERTTVGFTVAYDELAEVTESELVDSHIYGVYSEDDNMTSVVAYEPDYDDIDTTSSGPEPASLDEISQAKYGYDYDQLSSETQTQIEEIHSRQPFAAGLVLTEVLTREQIARWRFDLDVEPGDNFEFTAIDIETQQRIEADFDAQFQSQTGDRIESWDELARQRYGSEYEALTAEQQRTIRERYREQFEDS